MRIETAVPALIAILATLPALAQEPVAQLPEPAPVPAPAPETSGFTSEFTFGSYGRAQIYFDEDGNRGRNLGVVAHGPRLAEPSYAELDLGTRFAVDDGFDSRVLITLALFEPWAHYSGLFGDQGWAVRNLWADAGGFVPGLEGLRLWAGSRMYRGDDIYLLDFWPLDDLNTVGGGAMLALGGLDVRVHAGVNRLDDSYQLQVIKVQGAAFGTRDVVLLDRQRLIMSLKAGYDFENVLGDTGFGLALYAEAHHLPAGERIPDNLVQDGVPIYAPEDITEPLPEDRGFVIGGELRLFGFGPASHLNLFARYATGLAAYGELGVPFGTASDGTADGARELVVALSGSWESRWVGVMAGAYLRRFVDADVNRYDTDDFAEGALALRPVVFLTEHFHQAFEVSYQQHRPFGLDPETDDQEVAEVWQLTIMEILGLGRGCTERPQLRLYYTLGLPNSSSQRTWSVEDQRRPSRPEHLFGLGAEWWFNSSSRQ
jgi:maltoporin